MLPGLAPVALLQALEERLLDPAVRASPEALRELLAPDFIEHAASGGRWDRAGIITALQAQIGQPTPHRRLRDFTARLLGEGLALATYSTEIDTIRSLRCSLWRLGPEGWQMVFHQGTPQPD